MKKIVLLVLLVFSIQSFAQTIKGKEKKITTIENNKDSVIVTITITRTDTIKTRYSPKIQEVRRETKKKLEEYLQKLEEYLQYKTEIKTLEANNKELLRKNKKLQENNTESTNTITKIQRKIDILEEKEKENVKTEINFIIQQESNSYTEKILSITKERAIRYKINTDILEQYISTRGKLIKAQNLLSNPYNKTNIDKKIIELDRLTINNQFSGLIKERDEIIDLLGKYETKCNKLSDFILITLKGANKNTLKQSLSSDYLKKYKDYPYLVTIIEQKLNNKKTSTFGCN